MPPRKKLFEELGLLNQENVANPYKVLGIDPNFANKLLAEDPSGEAVKIVATGLYKVLSRRYHPDIPETGSDEKHQELTSAKERIDAAEKAALSRWTKTDTPTSSSFKDKRLEAEKDSKQRIISLFEASLELGNHPQHFSRLQQTHGLLAERGSALFLLRSSSDGSTEVLRGENQIGYESRLLTVPAEATDETKDEKAIARFDILKVLASYGNFGLTAGDKVAAYVDENGQTSLLSSDLAYLMDITMPVRDYLSSSSSRADAKKFEGPLKDAWLRSAQPTLLITSIPEGENHVPASRSIYFSTGQEQFGAVSGYAIAGSLTDRSFYKRAKHSRSSAHAAISGQKATLLSGMDIRATSVNDMVGFDAGYTPLLRPGNSVLFYDNDSGLPFTSDITVVGLVGSTRH